MINICDTCDKPFTEEPNIVGTNSEELREECNDCYNNITINDGSVITKQPIEKTYTTMENEFVGYTQALALKELGFDEPTIFSFANKELMVRLGDFEASWCMMGELEVMDYNNIPSLPNHISAPTYQQAFRWFRDKHNIITQIIYCTEKLEHISPEEVGYYGIILLLKNKEDEKYLDHWYKTYEETEQACINKLIEICKTKNNG